MPNIALLAPIPLEHLVDAVTVCNAEGKVAFGSRAWEVFYELEIERNNLPVKVYIYASGAPCSEKLEAAWSGRYIGYVDGKNGTHPDKMQFRPPSTAKYPSDNKGHWAVFWELDELRKLELHERIPTSEFTGYKMDKPYKKNFVPKGPLLVKEQVKHKG